MTGLKVGLIALLSYGIIGIGTAQDVPPRPGEEGQRQEQQRQQQPGQPQQQPQFEDDLEDDDVQRYDDQEDIYGRDQEPQRPYEDEQQFDDEGIQDQPYEQEEGMDPADRDALYGDPEGRSEAQEAPNATGEMDEQSLDGITSCPGVMQFDDMTIGELKEQTDGDMKIEYSSPDSEYRFERSNGEEFEEYKADEGNVEARTHKDDKKEVVEFESDEGKYEYYEDDEVIQENFEGEDREWSLEKDKREMDQ